MTPARYSLRRARNVAKPGEPAEVETTDAWTWKATQTPGFISQPKRRAANKRARASRKASRR